MRYCLLTIISLCTMAPVVLYAQEMEVGYRPEIYEAPSESAKEAILSSGRSELVAAYEQQEREAREAAEAQERESARYRDMPTREEAESYGPEESYWERQERAEEESRRRARAEARGEELERLYRQMPPTQAELMQEGKTAREAKVAAYQQAYKGGELRPPRFERAYPEPGYVRARKRIEEERAQSMPIPKRSSYSPDRFKLEMELEYPRGSYPALDEQLAKMERLRAYGELAGPETKSRIQETLDVISQALNTVAENPRVQSALNAAGRAFKNAREEAGKRTAGARAKMNEYINQGIEALRAVRAQMPSGPFNEWLAEHAGVVDPEAGRDISIKLKEEKDPFGPGMKQEASEWAKKYRKAVKDFDNRKKLKATPEYETFLKNLIYTFDVIKSAIQTNPDLKRAVTSYVVPLLIRKWKGEKVLIDYIDEYLKKLEYELGNVTQGQFRPLISDLD